MPVLRCSAPISPDEKLDETVQPRSARLVVSGVQYDGDEDVSFSFSPVIVAGALGPCMLM
jgi:hypothetical protein